MKLIRSESYIRKESKFFERHQNLLEKYLDVLERLCANPFDPALKTHKLKGKLKAFHGCSLTFEYRIVCTILIQDDKVILVDIGTHDEVYN